MKVSILIPCYNAERWIAEAIRSALAQTHRDKEVVVVDDGSTDRSAEVIRSFGDAVRFEPAAHRGGNATRNRLLQLAGGGWLQYLDADDYLLPDKVAVQIEHAERRPAADVIYSPATLEHWNAEHAERREVLPIREPRDPWELLVRWSLPQTGTVIWRREAVEAVGGWREDQPCCQEHELYLRLLQAGKQFEYCPHSGAVYRQWSEGTVCRRDPLLTYRQRLKIVRAAEAYLQSHDLLTEARRDAIAHARLECARIVYHLDREEALALARESRRRHPAFVPPTAASFPAHYRMLYRMFGFSTAERIAACLRPLKRGLRKLQKAGAQPASEPVSSTAS